jgi:hypothetical protein
VTSLLIVICPESIVVMIYIPIVLAAASDKVYQLVTNGRWFSPGTPASSTTESGV